MLATKDKGILLQIVKRCNRIDDILSNVTKKDFDSDDNIKELACFNLFQIGELANSLSDDFIMNYNEIPWKQIIGMRNKIVHGYATVEFDIVWDTSKDSVPQLNSYCKKVLSDN